MVSVLSGGPDSALSHFILQMTVFHGEHPRPVLLIIIQVRNP